jgi:hypothetical protein
MQKKRSAKQSALLLEERCQYIFAVLSGHGRAGFIVVQ